MKIIIFSSANMMPVYFEFIQDRIISFSNSRFIIMCEVILDQKVVSIVFIHGVIDGGWFVVGILISGLFSNN